MNNSQSPVNTSIDGGFFMAVLIDKIVLTSLAAAGLYLFFLNAWGSIPLAMALAFACAALGRRLIAARPRRRHASLERVRGELLRLAGLPDAQAQAELTALANARWPGEDFALAPVLKHADAPLTSGDLLNASKPTREAARLVVAATCPAEPRALAYARQLRSPAVAVVDSRALSRLLRKALPPESTAPRTPVRQRLRRLAARVATVRVSPKNVLLAAAMLMLYLRGAGPLYLFGALLLLAHLGMALIQRRVGKRLFEE